MEKIRHSVRKIIYIALSVIMCAGLICFAACSEDNGQIFTPTIGEYTGEAVMYSHCDGLMKKSFLRKNKVCCADNGYNSKYPDMRTFMIDSKKKYKSVFVRNAVDVDFSYQVIYVYVYSDMTLRNCCLDRINITEGAVEIYYAQEYYDWEIEEGLESWELAADGCEPGRMCMAVVMDNQGIEDVEFTDAHKIVIPA